MVTMTGKGEKGEQSSRSGIEERQEEETGEARVI